MNETKHTPGPWKTLNGDLSLGVGQDIIIQQKLHSWGIALVHNYSNMTKGQKAPDSIAQTAQANAALIAAAPELLEACEQMSKHGCEFFASMDRCDVTRPLCPPCKARAAVAKAKKATT